MYAYKGSTAMKFILHLLFTLLHHAASSPKGDFIQLETNFRNLLYVVSGGSGGSGDSCSQHCVPSALWSYQVGREYTYDYQVEAISSMKGTTDEESSLMIEAKVTFKLLSPCNFLLKVWNNFADLQLPATDKDWPVTTTTNTT